jgi:hypothetical protein
VGTTLYDECTVTMQVHLLIVHMFVRAGAPAWREIVIQIFLRSEESESERENLGGKKQRV